MSGLLPEGPWYDNQPVCHNVLKSKLKEMFKIAGLNIEGKTNHSLRATGISRLYSAGVPEKLIMQRSGHLSKEGLRGYERTSAQQEKAVSDLLTSSASCYSESLQNQDRSPLKDIKICPEADHDESQNNAEKYKKVKDMFSLSGCNVTINMKF